MKITHLRASSAHRWIECHMSPHAERIAPSIQDDNDAALEGSAAHKLFELALKKRVQTEVYVDEDIRVGAGSTFVDYTVSEDMADHVQDGVDLVTERRGKGVLWTEREVHFKVRGVVVGGTLDAGWLGTYKSEVKKTKGRNTVQLHIMDLKYGRLLVEAHDNKQMLIYANGKLRELTAAGKKVDEIHMWVYQPRNEVAAGVPFQHVTITPYELEEFVAVELDAAVQGILSPKPAYKAGPQCLYCKAQSTCPAAEKLVLKHVRTKFKDTDRERVGELLFVAGFVGKWAERVRALGKQMGADRQPPTGWKMVPGNRIRRFPGKEKEQLKILPKLKAKFKLDDDTLAPRKLLSVSKMEKALKEAGKDIDALEKFYIEARQKDRLVPESDKRDSIGASMYFDAEPDDGQV